MDLAAALGQAFAWEEENRELAFLGLSAPLCGVPVVPLSLRRMTFLLQAKSAFFYGRAPALEDVALFLWACSPKFRPGDPERQGEFLTDLCAGSALADMDAMLAAIKDYLEAAQNDAPAGQVVAPGKEKEPVFCFVAHLVDPLAKEYGWSLGDIMEMPLALVYQMLRKIALRNNEKAVFFNRRSRKVRGDWLRALTAKSAES